MEEIMRRNLSPDPVHQEGKLLSAPAEVKEKPHSDQTALTAELQPDSQGLMTALPPDHSGLMAELRPDHSELITELPPDQTELKEELLQGH